METYSSYRVLSEHTCVGPGFVSRLNLEHARQGQEGGGGELVTKHLFIAASIGVASHSLVNILYS